MRVVIDTNDPLSTLLFTEGSMMLLEFRYIHDFFAVPGSIIHIDQTTQDEGAVIKSLNFLIY